MTHVVGFGGTPRSGSATEIILRQVLGIVEASGHTTELFHAARLDFPFYDPKITVAPPPVAAFLAAVRSADGIVIGSPGYHGNVSGLVKNAIDWLELLRDDERPYLEGRQVGLIVVSAGVQATVTTLMSLRSTVHALRGWPTPYGLAVSGAEASPADLELLADQVLRVP